MANTKIPRRLSSTPSIVDGGNATAITIDSSENIGIGTTSPTAHLHLESAGATQLRVRTSSSSSEPQIIIQDGAGDYFAMQKADRGMTFKPQGAEAMRIDDSGNVGIGTTGPQTQLHVADTNNSAGDLYTAVGAGNVPSITIQNAGTTDNNNAGLFFRDNDGMVASVAARFVSHTSGDEKTQLRFSVTGAGNTREKMTLTEDGHLGIGTTAPNVDLDVYNDSGWGGVDIDGTSGGELRLMKAGTAYGNLYASNSHGLVINAANGLADISIQSGGSEKMRIDDSGNITKPGHPVFDVSTTASALTGEITYNTVYVNVGSHYSTSTGRFTAPVAGTYMFTTQYIKNATSGVCRRNLKLNGSNASGMNGGRQLRMDSGQSYGDNGNMIIIATLAAGDYVQVNQYVGASHGGTAYEQFSGFLIG